MMKGIISFIKKHVLFSIVIAPAILLGIVLAVGLPLLAAVAPFRQLALMKATTFFAFLLIILIVFVYPLILTVCNVYFIVKRYLTPFQKRISALTEAATIVAGTLLSWLYITEVTEIVFRDWPVALYNSQIHTPIATWTFPTILTMAGIGVLGYVILRMIPLKETPPLVTVLSMSAMYIGCLMCVLWMVQTFAGNGGGIYLYLFPVNCILIAAKVIRGLLWQWQELYPKAGRQGREPEDEHHTVMNRFQTILQNSANWPWLALLFMLPLLGIIIMVLTLFGQKPDSIIKAWTETSQWSMSQKISPQNLPYDTHYLCTVAAGGHRRVVRPIRMGVRHGHRVIVNRQLCVANAFEQILMERVPRFHRLVRRVYDRYGFPLARHIRSKAAADVIYILMKPLEWLFLAVIYLCDAHPENRIAMQYIPPVDQPQMAAGPAVSGRRTSCS